MKAFKDRLSHLKPKSKLDSASAEDEAEAGAANGPPSPGTPAAPMTPPQMNLSRSISPAPPGATPPRGPIMMKSGPPPPGAKIMKGPPPSGMPGVFASQGHGGTSPNMSLMRPGASPPPGAKIMSGPPPTGAKIMSGPPPQGARIVSGPVPPGAKKMMGAPPPGASVLPRRPTTTNSPPSPGTSVLNAGSPMRLAPGAPPPGAKMMSGPPPPGAKVIHGAPPPGARLVKAPMSRPTTPEASMSKSPVLNLVGGSRPQTPEQSRMMSIKSIPGGLPMRKSISGPPPPGAKVIPMKMPPGGGNVPLRAVSPPAAAGVGKAPVKMQMRLSPGRPGDPPSPKLSSPPTPQLVPQNASFSHPPTALQSAKSQILRPLPVRGTKSPAGGANAGVRTPSPPSVLVSKANGLLPAHTGSAPAKIPLPGGGDSAGDGGSDDVNFHMEESSAAGDGGEIEFDESPLEIREEGHPAEAAKKDRGGDGPLHPHAGAAASSNSSTFFHEEADIETAPPPPAAVRNKSPSMGSIQSSSFAIKTEGSASAPVKRKTMVPRRDKDADVENSKPRRRSKHHSRRKKHRRRHEDAADGDGRPSSSSDSLTSSSASSASSRRGSRAKDRKGHSSRTPAAVERTRRKERREGASGGGRGSRRYNAEEEDGGDDSADGGYLGSVGTGSSAPNFSEKALTTTALTPSLRSKIADQFLSILCPQQYYGKVKKINGIRPLNADRAQATGLRRHNCIYVATKGVMPNRLFYPQLRLYEGDGRPTVDDKNRGAYDTPIILYEAAPGNMLFAETEQDAVRLLDTNKDANSCFVLSASAILFKDPEHFVLPLAMLNVCWTPYSSAQSEPQCPIHHKELQLFDPYTKELVCALCASKDSAHLSKLVVIPDVLSGDSRRRIHESVARQLDEAQHSAKMWVGQHQRIHQLCRNKKEAIQQQFELLAAAVEAKRKEFIEACEAEYGLAQSDVAREILVSDERVQLLAAAADHLRTEASRPLYSMQIATIAEGLEAPKQLPSSFSKQSLSVPLVSTTVMPNLEAVMADLQALSPDQECGARINRSRARSAISHSPFQTGRYRSRTTSDQVVIRTNGRQSLSRSPPRSRSAGAGYRSHVSGGTSPRSRRDLYDDDDYNVPRRSVSVGGGGGGMSPRRLHQHRAAAVTDSPRRATHGTPQQSLRRAPPPPLPSPSGRSNARSRSRAGVEHADDDRDNDDGVASTYRMDAVTVPNSTGTSLFDYPLDELLNNGDADEHNAVNGGGGGPPRLRKPPTVQWTIRVEDPGDWVGIGVGVGTSIDAWESGRSNDLSHLWIVPGGPLTSGSGPSERQTYQLRVTVTPTVGHARLSIHDSRGRQLDDGSIPQWNATRVCYPQVTFGGRIGQVRMIEAPHIIS